MRATRLTVIAIILASAAVAAAQKKPATAEGVKLASTVHPDRGYVDDPFVFDGSGGRLALVRTDGSEFAEIEILDFGAGGKSVARIDITKVTVSPEKVVFIGDGDQLLVVSRPLAGDKATAFVIDQTGKVLRKWGPATDFAIADIGGADGLTVFDSKPAAKGGGTVYDIAVFDLETGKAVGKKRTLAADATGEVATAGITVLWWQNGYTQAVGRKKGLYDKYKDQRMNDSIGVYDVIEGTIVKDVPIADVIGRTKLEAIRANYSNQPIFVTVAEDQKSLVLINIEDAVVPVTLAEPFHKYDPKSVKQEIGRDGRIYFTLTIDPVNIEAVNRKATDPELIDLYVLDAAGGQATRLARLPKGDRPFSWHIASGRWVVLRKHKAFARGGMDLEIYELSSPAK
jgi:hypothetical protein